MGEIGFEDNRLPTDSVATPRLGAAMVQLFSRRQPKEGGAEVPLTNSEVVITRAGDIVLPAPRSSNLAMRAGGFTIKRYLATGSGLKPIESGRHE